MTFSVFCCSWFKNVDCLFQAYFSVCFCLPLTPLQLTEVCGPIDRSLTSIYLFYIVSYKTDVGTLDIAA